MLTIPGSLQLIHPALDVLLLVGALAAQVFKFSAIVLIFEALLFAQLFFLSLVNLFQGFKGGTVKLSCVHLLLTELLHLQ